ncbi:uncharacterized protein LOC129798794 [Phlebotomus papatasi]|uniref:uncharacterized protein LOC129798794 n=1 Tax=Phlebotomus papatasi TaxID=29031 RepID=UPI002484017C|nr:uncharacterized protein LOC129798794 [Phlebotomus papatasi]
MAALVGAIEPYIPGENFNHYRRRMDHLMAANDIEEGKKKSVTISLMGSICYAKLVSLLAPASPEDDSTTYKEMMDTLEEHFKESNNVIAERCQFNMRVRQEGESVEDYIVEIKSMAQECHFNNCLEECLRDRLVSGINDKPLQSKLISKRDLTWERARELCIAEFRARRNVKQMEKSMSGGAAIHVLETQKKITKSPNQQKQRFQGGARKKIQGKQQKSNNQQSSSSGSVCGRCNLSHNRGECRAYNSICRQCNRKGHWAICCRTKSE